MSDKTLSYLASPYSSPFAAIRKARYEIVCSAAARLIRHGYLIFSPIAHSHAINEKDGIIGKKWEHWKDFDLLMLDKCDELFVLVLEGWKESVGVQAEIAYAKEKGKPISYVDPVTAEFMPIEWRMKNATTKEKTIDEIRQITDLKLSGEELEINPFVTLNYILARYINDPEIADAFACFLNKHKPSQWRFDNGMV